LLSIHFLFLGVILGKKEIYLRGKAYLTSIDWSFLKAVMHDDSAVAPSSPRSLSLQDETGGGGGGYP
jgi:hypothetical protein